MGRATFFVKEIIIIFIHGIGVSGRLGKVKAEVARRHLELLHQRQAEASPRRPPPTRLLLGDDFREANTKTNVKQIIIRYLTSAKYRNIEISKYGNIEIAKYRNIEISARLGKVKAEVVGRHLDLLAQGQTESLGDLLQLANVPDAPVLIRRPELGIEGPVALSSVSADELPQNLERSVHHQMAPRPQRQARAPQKTNRARPRRDVQRVRA